MKSKRNLAGKKLFWPLIGAHRSIWRKTTYLHETGWVESLKRGYPCDKHGTEVPWMNYSVIAILREKLDKSMRLFEYGCGYSTSFYSSLVKNVVSLEYDKVWMDHIKYKIPDNVELIYREKDSDGDYCRVIAGLEGTFDVVIVDGRDRVNCVKQAQSKLSERGVIVLDDSSRDKYCEAIDFAESRGFRSLHIEGLKPTGRMIDRTTIFYRSDNCLSI